MQFRTSIGSNPQVYAFTECAWEIHRTKPSFPYQARPDAALGAARTAIRSDTQEMRKAIIAIPEALSHHELNSLHALLIESNPELGYEFEHDRIRSRPDVRAFVGAERPADDFTYMSSLQSALYKFDSMVSARSAR